MDWSVLEWIGADADALCIAGVGARAAGVVAPCLVVQRGRKQTRRDRTRAEADSRGEGEKEQAPPMSCRQSQATVAPAPTRYRRRHAGATRPRRAACLPTAAVVCGGGPGSPATAEATGEEINRGSPTAATGACCPEYHTTPIVAHQLPATCYAQQTADSRQRALRWCGLSRADLVCFRCRLLHCPWSMHVCV
jgi:hypothetical protein